MATSNQPAWFTGLSSTPSKTTEQVKKGQEITKGSIDIQTETAKAPFAGPQAATNLKKDRLQVIRDAKTYGRDLRKEFDATEAVKTYREGMRYFTTALRTPPNSAGDQDLVTLAAKVQDPTGAVMQGDIDRYNNIQVALERLPAAFKNEFVQTGKFSEKTRKDIRTFITNRVLVQRDAYNDARKSYVTDIEDFNSQTGDLGVKPLDAATVLGTHPATLYKDKILAYDATQKAADKVAERSGLMSTPEGMRISGEDVKGFRFSPEAESSINAYTKAEDATAEGYAKLLADAAVKEGFIDEGQRGNYEAQTAIDNAEVFKVPPAQRGGIDYKAIDEAASKNAGLFETVAQAGRNLPESAAQLVTGLGGMIANPIETVKTTADLAGALLQGNTDDPTVQAAAKVLEEQYGGVDNLHRYMIKDPLAFLGDASMLLSGSGFALKTAGLTKAGEGLSTAGRIIDPLSGAVALATDVPAAAYQKAKTAAPGALTGVENLPSNIAGFPSNIGGDVIREGAGAGFERGRVGAETPRSEAFTQGMRAPGESAEGIVTAARDAVAGLRAAAGKKYQDAMQQFGKNPAPLDINNVRQRMVSIKPRNYDAMVDAPKRPSDHLAWEQMNNAVEYYAEKAVADPNLLMPMEMDQFKQDLYNIGSTIGGAYDRDAANIARTAYNGVRQELVKHDPLYNEIMKDYEKVAVEARQLEDVFKLSQARGKPMKTDAAAKALQSIYRNNAFTGYGMRAKQGERIAELDPTGTFSAANAGMMASAPFPRGVTAGVAAGNLPLTGLAAALNPATLLATVPILAASSPRLAGELSYGAGRVAGTGARAFDAVAGSKVGQGLGAAGTGLSELYQKYPEMFLAGTQAGTLLDKIDAQALADKYVGAPVAPAGDVAAEEQITVTGTRNPAQSIADLATQYEVPPAAVAPVAEAAPAVPTKTRIMFEDKEVEYDPETDTYVELATGRRVKELPELRMPPATMYRGGTVQAFGNGGQAKSPPKRTSFFDDAIMAVSRRSNDLVAAAADLADKYGLTVPDTTAWIAQNVAGYSPQQANQIRKNLGGMSNRGIVEAGASSNETRFRNAGGRGARSADMVSAPVRMSDVAYRVQDIPRAVVSETPKALQAVGNYIANTSPQTMLGDAQRVGSSVINAIKEDPYGIAVDTALYPAFPVAASMSDFAAMRGGARQLSPYTRGDAEAAKAKAMVDALSVLPIGGGMAGRRVARRR